MDRDDETTAPALPENPWPASIAIMIGTMMVYLDTTVVNLSLPHMAGSLSATVEEATWTLTSYLAANAVILPLAGWLANLFGRKRLILLALVGFVVSSLLCGFATSIGELVIFRVTQGMCGGLLQPLSQSVLLESFPIDERGKAMGFWSAGIVMAPVLGPLVGGYLTEAHSWRWVFFINVPFGILSIMLVQAFVADPPYVRRRIDRIDWRAIVLLVLGVACIQVMLDQGQQEDWFDSRFIVTLLVVGIASLTVFVVRSLHAAGAVVDLRVFKNQTFAVGSVLSTLIGFLLFGSIVVMPLLLQTLLGQPPLLAGITIMPRAFGSLIAFPIVGLLTDRYEPRRLLVSGLVLGALTMFWFSTFDQNVTGRDLLLPQLLQGTALGLLFVPLSTATMRRIPLASMGNATSVFNATRNFGSSFGIAIVATYLERSRSRHYDILREQVDYLSSQSVDRLQELSALYQSAGADPVTADQQALASLSHLVGRQASMLAFLDIFRLFGIVFLAMVPLVLFLNSSRER